jgi:hypothetical protein
VAEDYRNLDPIPEEEQPDLPADWTPSQSFLRHHDRCDRAALLYLRHRGGAATHELNRGALMHEAIDRLLRMLVASQRERVQGIGTDLGPGYVADAREHAEHLAEQLENTIPPELGRQVLYEVMADNPEMQVSAAERDSLRYLMDHFCRGTHFEPNQIIGIEKTLTLETGGFRVLIRPDLIEDLGGGVCRIRDWKSAWPPDSEDFRAQAYDSHGNPRWAGNYQLNMAAVVAAFGVTDDGLPLGNFERFILSLEYPRILRDDGIDTRTVEVDRLQVQSFRDDLDLQLHRLREVCLGKRKWQPTEGNHCRECPCEYECPLPRHLRPESQLANLDSIEDLERAATNWHFGTGRMAKLKSRLKKAAEGLPDSDLDLGDGLRGVRIGTDLALVFTPTKTEKIIDRDNMFAAAEAAAKFGEPFDRAQHVKVSEGVTFAKKRIPPRRENGEVDG